MGSKLLVYGFRSFGKNHTNISEEIIKTLPDFPELTKHIYQVRFNRRQILEPVEKLEPNIIIGLGQYPRGNTIRFERKTVNLYKEGEDLLHIDSEGERELLTTLSKPNSYLVRETNNAGVFVCNYSMYTLLQWCNKHHARFGFFHVPKRYSLQQVVKLIENWLLVYKAKP